MLNFKNTCGMAVAMAAAMLVSGLSATAHAAPLGVTAGEPKIAFDGMIDYVASTRTVTISGTPSSIFRSDPLLAGLILGASPDNERLVSIQFLVDSSGNFVSGVAGPDVTIKGSIDTNFDEVPDYDGILLQAEISQFGFQDGGVGGTDLFDFRLVNVTGLLAPLYVGSDLSAIVFSEPNSEYPTPFTGSWAADFTGPAKGTVGTVAPLQPPVCKLHLDAYCSVNGGPNASKCRIKVVKSPSHWEWEDRDDHGTPYKSFTYGMHGDPLPNWAKKSAGTNVKFSYVVKNTGATQVTGLQVSDSFDTPVLGVPASLDPGQSVTLTRTENLREDLENEVHVTGMYQSAKCGDNDEVVIKDQLRDRRRHDYDDYKDKGMGDQGSYR